MPNWRPMPMPLAILRSVHLSDPATVAAMSYSSSLGGFLPFSNFQFQCLILGLQLLKVFA